MILGLGVTFHHQSHIPLRAGRHRPLLTSPGSPTPDESKNVATETQPPGVARSGQGRAHRAVSCAPSLIPRHAKTGTRHVGHYVG